MAEIDSTARRGHHAVQLNGEQIEDLSVVIGKATGIASLMATNSDVAELDRFAAEAITEYLVAARRILKGEEAHHD